MQTVSLGSGKWQKQADAVLVGETFRFLYSQDKIKTQTTNHSSQLDKSWWVEVGGMLSAFKAKSRGIHMTPI